MSDNFFENVIQYLSFLKKDDMSRQVVLVCQKYTSKIHLANAFWLKHEIFVTEIKYTELNLRRNSY